MFSCITTCTRSSCAKCTEYYDVKEEISHGEPPAVEMIAAEGMHVNAIDINIFTSLIKIFHFLGILGINYDGGAPNRHNILPCRTEKKSIIVPS